MRHSRFPAAAGPDRARELGVDLEESAGWRDAAKAMFIPYDEALGVHPQDEGSPVLGQKGCSISYEAWPENGWGGPDPSDWRSPIRDADGIITMPAAEGLPWSTP